FMLIFCVGLLAFVGRVRAVRNRQMRLRDFEVLDLNTAEAFVARSTRHIANLFEVPVLFYVVCLVALSLRVDDRMALVIAWTYVAMRVVHSFIHLTYNRVMHRMLVFMSSNLVLLVLWIRLLTQI
ncbi:MAG TPA: MAPEG family protein, partial [Polyangiaceae bacterium]|nr:MAPEG family protein [Polyangiaceae bacterium]